MKHLNITVSGKVQGVFLRASDKKKAQGLGIVGSVMNKNDGSVYLEAEANMPQRNTHLSVLSLVR